MGTRTPRRRRTLTAKQKLFVAEYLSNGQNATRAYQATHPGCKPTTAAENGSKLLRYANVAAFVAAELEKRFKRLGMTGDEAFALVSETARARLADCFDADGALLPLHQMPERAQIAIKALRRGKDGELTITLHDSLKARELLAQAAGKLKTPVFNMNFDHARYLADELESDKDE